jgi:hypothetical protein
MVLELLALGAVSALGLFILFMRLPRFISVPLLHMPFVLDFGFTALMMWMHWGTFGGIMVATFAGLCGSAGISLARAVVLKPWSKAS